MTVGWHLWKPTKTSFEPDVFAVYFDQPPSSVASPTSQWLEPREDPDVWCACKPARCNRKHKLVVGTKRQRLLLSYRQIYNTCCIFCRKHYIWNKKERKLRQNEVKKYFWGWHLNAGQRKASSLDQINMVMFVSVNFRYCSQILVILIRSSEYFPARVNVNV